MTRPQKSGTGVVLPFEQRFKPPPLPDDIVVLPVTPQTVDEWRSLLFQQIRIDPQWVDVALIDFDGIEAVIRAIATHGVHEPKRSA